MKTKTFLISVITLFLLTALSGCDNDICTFNIDDPINDLEWLKNEIEKMDTPTYSVRFWLYQNKENPEKYFFEEEVQIVGGGQQSIMGYSYIVVYNGKGEIKISTRYDSTSSTDALNDFSVENTLIKQIWPKN